MNCNLFFLPHGNDLKNTSIIEHNLFLLPGYRCQILLHLMVIKRNSKDYSVMNHLILPENYRLEFLIRA